MNNSTIVFLINDDVRAIQGRYEDGGKAETFKTMDPTIGVDDLVVVESTTRHMMTVVKVTAVDVDLDFDTSESVKWVVQRIDKPSFDETLALEREAITAVQTAERRRKKDELRRAMFADHEASLQALRLANHVDGDVTE